MRRLKSGVDLLINRQFLYDVLIVCGKLQYIKALWQIFERVFVVVKNRIGDASDHLPVDGNDFDLVQIAVAADIDLSI